MSEHADAQVDELCRKHDELRLLAVATGDPALLLAWARAELDCQMVEGRDDEEEEIPF